MKNKLYLNPDEIRKNLYPGDYAGCLSDYAGTSSYICDAILEIADNNTSIYYSDIIKYISGHVEEASDAINEFGWDGCGGDLYKAGQMAEYETIRRDIEDNIEDGLKVMALDYIQGRTCTRCGLHYSAIPAALWEAVEECASNSPDSIEEITDAIDDWDNAHHFEVWEDNGGTVTLIIYDDDNRLEYMHCYNGEIPGQLAQDLLAYFFGDCPADDWDGNELDELVERAGSFDALMAEYTEHPGQIAQIAGPGWIDWNRMGGAAQTEFGTEEDNA